MCNFIQIAFKIMSHFASKNPSFEKNLYAPKEMVEEQICFKLIEQHQEDYVYLVKYNNLIVNYNNIMKILIINLKHSIHLIVFIRILILSQQKKTYNT